ncbi:hypothetical protein J8J14_13740 [Roseomonas sp. SSH11]|uniref:Mce/MlaD domain-containing protein n=1 Tax=Pararoseomonas baculiformis TaxID=2820812 RepID=A0ABS4AFM3_9PROT|nr:hypothetical protein [Pararoseomonas baculiformis]MBP0445837.1 hypothetical protein [Pararoseomonas baculiformis]
MAGKAAFKIQLQGFAQANRDAEVELKNEATGQVITRKPFLDGSLLIRDLDPGAWEVKVSHPNLTLPIARQRIRLFPQNIPTYVPIPIPANLFRDTPIRDLPDADLGPVQQAVAAVQARVAPVADKAPGEVIRASDFNALSTAIGDLAGSVGELSRLVSPRGHDHPEIAERIDEVQANLRAFAEAFGRSLVELRRELELLSLRRAADDVLNLGNASPLVRDDLKRRLDELEDSLQTDTGTFTGKLARAGQAILNGVQTVGEAQPPETREAFLNDAVTRKLNAVASQYSSTGTVQKRETELQTYTRTGVSIGNKLGGVIRGT